MSRCPPHYCLWTLAAGLALAGCATLYDPDWTRGRRVDPAAWNGRQIPG